MAALLTALSVPARAGAQQVPPTMPVDQIKPGMTGYGLTVFRGFKIERFKVKVIDVIHNFLPKQDVILVRIAHPVLTKAKVVGGMSGSPIFINDKLIGALAYGWRFSAEPITGITNIQSMLDMLKVPLRGPKKTQSPRTLASNLRIGAPRPADQLAIASLSRRDRWWRPALPSRRRHVSPKRMLEPVSVPLSVSGFARESFAELRQAFSAYGFEPVQGGGTGGKPEGPKKFIPGGAIGVQLVSGDKAMVGTGTVTTIKGNKVLGFGHSAFNAGELYLPVVSAKIIHTLASVARSFKLSRPARVLGALEQDRQAAIQANTKLRVGTVPMTVRMRGKSVKGGAKVDSTFRVRLAKHRLLTGSLTRSVVSSALSQAMADIDRMGYRMRTTMKIKGRAQPITIDEQGHTDVGVRRGGLYFARGLRAIRGILGNPFVAVEPERIDVDIDVNFREQAVKVTGVRLSSLSVEPGSRISVYVTMRAYGEKPVTRAYPLTIPASLSGSVLRLEVAGGSRVSPLTATPQNLEQFIKNLTKSYSGRSLVISIYTPAQGVAIGGRVINDLPGSIFDSLNTGSQKSDESSFRAVSRRVFPVKRVVEGRKRLRLRVRDENE